MLTVNVKDGSVVSVVLASGTELVAGTDYNVVTSTTPVEPATPEAPADVPADTTTAGGEQATA